MSWHTESESHEAWHTAGLALDLIGRLYEHGYSAAGPDEAATLAAAALCVLPGRVQEGIDPAIWSNADRTNHAKLLIADAIGWAQGLRYEGSGFAETDQRVRQAIRGRSSTLRGTPSRPTSTATGTTRCPSPTSRPN